MGITITPGKKTGGGGGTVTGAESGTGIVSGKVRLGINPLLQAARIINQGFLFSVNSNAGTEVSESELIIFGDVGQLTSYDGLGNSKSLLVQASNGIGIEFVDEIDNIGLQGQVDYSMQSPGAIFGMNTDKPLQAIQRSGVNFKLYNNAIGVLSGIQSFLMYTVPPTDSGDILRFNGWLMNYAGSAGNVAVSLSYNDPQGNLVNLALGSIAPNTSSNFQSVVFCAGANSPVTFIATGTVSDTFGMAGNLEFINSVTI